MKRAAFENGEGRPSSDGPRRSRSPFFSRLSRVAELASLAALAALAACEDPGLPLSPYPGDGVSGFGKAALVDVCIGSARAIPGGAAAVCVQDGADTRACSSDAECAGPERCQCGRCFVRVCTAGTVCPAGEACRGGRCTTTCVEDDQCAADELCDGGGCTRACQSDAACHRGEVCNLFGACAAEPCGPSLACGSGQTCEPVAIDGDVREPAVVEIRGEPVAFFELRSAAGAAVYRARFSDAEHLLADPPSPVLSPPPGATHVGAPSLVTREDRVDLFVALGSGASIGLAISGDGGRTFTWSSETSLVPGPAWEAGFVGSPAALQHDGETFVFYEGGPGLGIGLARAAGSSLERVSTSPVLVPDDLEDAAFWRGIQSIEAPFALVAGDVVRVYVTAHGIEGGAATTPSGSMPARANDSIGLFATRDLATFDRFPTGPVVSTLSGLFGAQGEREPSVRVTDEGADLYFVATDAAGTISAGLAHASTER